MSALRSQMMSNDFCLS